MSILQSQLSSFGDQGTVLTYLGAVEDLNLGGVATLTATNFNTSSFLPTDRMIILVAGDGTTAGAVVNSVTVGGVAATADLQPAATGQGFAAIFSITGINAATQTIIATMNRTTTARGVIMILRARKNNFTIPVLKASDYQVISATTGSTPTDTLNLPAYSAGVLAFGCGDPTLSLAFSSPAVEYADVTFATEGQAHYGAAGIPYTTADRAALSITLTITGTLSQGYTLIGCSYG